VHTLQALVAVLCLVLQAVVQTEAAVLAC